MSGLDDPETKLVSEGKISHFVTLCIMTLLQFSKEFYQKEVVSECRQKKELLT